MRARAFEQGVNPGAFSGQGHSVQCGVLLVGQAQRVAGTHQCHRPHARAAAFKNARHRVVNFDAGAHIIDAQGNDVGQCLSRPRTTVGDVIGGDHMVGNVTIGGCQRHNLGHDLRRIPRAGTDFHALGTQCCNGLKRARNQRGMFGDFLDLQRHEALVNGRDVIVRRGAAEYLLIAFANLWLVAQGTDVIPLAHPHRTACFIDRHLYIKFSEGFDKDLRGGKRAKIDHSTGPIEDGCLKLAWLGVVHVF